MITVLTALRWVALGAQAYATLELWRAARRMRAVTYDDVARPKGE